MNPRAKKRILAVAVAVLLLIPICIAVEYGLRAAKSSQLDGTLYVRTSSINCKPHPKYGWISHASLQFEKNDECYGSGTITYSEDGFRTRPLASAKDADIVICILGDSTMQGFQIPDGGHLPHLLEEELRKGHLNPYVLPLAVGGYGSVQQWMLFEDFCRPLDPTVVIQHWSSNDVINNSYLAERYSGTANNNARPRPYLENDRIVMRQPYPLHLNVWFDDLMITRVANSLLLRWQMRSPQDLQHYLESGWSVAEEMASRVSQGAKKKIALVEATDDRAIRLFRAQGFLVAAYDPVPVELTCLPRDPHPNTEGHLHMLNALLPVLDAALQGGRPEREGFQK
jgi:hypothetical protein